MSRNPFRKKTVGFYEVMATPYTDTTTESKGGAKTDTSTSMNNGKQMDTNRNNSGVDTSPRGVGFNIKDSQIEKKKKYLTAKYGQHQMLLIKKRLKVEMWVFDELRKLYESEVCTVLVIVYLNIK